MLTDVQYRGGSAGDLDYISRPVTQNRAGKGGYVRDRAAWRIGFVLSDNTECLLATIISPQGEGHAERYLPLVIRRPDDLRIRTARPPVTDFSESGCRGVLVALVGRSSMSRLEAAKRSLDRPQSRFRHEIAVRREWTVGKRDRFDLGFLHKSAAHCILAKNGPTMFPL